MKQRQAYRIAIECIERAMKEYAFDANVAQKYGAAASGHAQRALKKYEELAQAVAWFETPKYEQMALIGMEPMYEEHPGKQSEDAESEGLV